MTHVVGLFALFLLSPSPAKSDSIANAPELEAQRTFNSPSPLHILASAYGTLGRYSTTTDSRSVSSYVTLTNSWRDYYTLGFATLWLADGSSGEKYYSQQFAMARAVVFVTERISLGGHYGYLYEGEISLYSLPAVFHFAGAGAIYWFSLFQVAGTSFTTSFSQGTIASTAYRGFFSLDIGNGIWATSTVVVTDADWSPSLFMFRQAISVPLGNNSYVIASADVGRRGFYFDDESLVVYNQRSIQSGSFLIKGVVQITDGLSIIPSLEYDTFDEYNVTYGSMGIRVLF